MFAATFIYMYIWVYTGEVNAKRLRERYLQAILRQDIAYFDNVGAGEVATRIQTDTRTCSLHLATTLGPMLTIFFVVRFGPARYFREGCARGQLFGRLRDRFRSRIHQVMASGSCAFVHSSLHRYHRSSYE